MTQLPRRPAQQNQHNCFACTKIAGAVRLGRLFQVLKLGVYEMLFEMLMMQNLQAIATCFYGLVIVKSLHVFAGVMVRETENRKNKSFTT